MGLSSRNKLLLKLYSWIIQVLGRSVARVQFSHMENKLLLGKPEKHSHVGKTGWVIWEMTLRQWSVLWSYMFVCLGTAANLCDRGKETFFSISCQLSNWQYSQ